MYRHASGQCEFPDFYLPFGGHLNAENRWVKLAKMVLWDEVERVYSKGFAQSAMGAPAKNSRMAFGALIIKERLGLSDRESVEQIRENPYLQYFLGLHEYRDEPLFDASTMVYFRSRFDQEQLEAINEKLVEGADAEEDQPESSQAEAAETQNTEEPSLKDPGQDQTTEVPLEGKLLIDATCAPADITYPTDLKLVGEAREKSQRILDDLYATIAEAVRVKPRTYRRQARQRFLAALKTKRLSPAKRRTAIGAQLRYLRRNIGHIDQLLDQGADLRALGKYWLKCLWVIREVYRQQLQMYRQHSQRIDDRIVSISQPHVRPIIRGKAGKNVEFGAKLSVSCARNMVFMDRIDWDNFNESSDLQGQVEAYRRRFGVYPRSVHADGIYRNRVNREYCRQRGIRLSGLPLGRRRKDFNQIAEQARQDELDRIPIEGKFGNAKRKGTLHRVMAKLPHTSLTLIHLSFIVLNLDTLLRLCRALSQWLYSWLLETTRPAASLT